MVWIAPFCWDYQMNLFKLCSTQSRSVVTWSSSILFLFRFCGIPIFLNLMRKTGFTQANETTKISNLNALYNVHFTTAAISTVSHKQAAIFTKIFSGKCTLVLVVPRLAKIDLVTVFNCYWWYCTIDYVTVNYIEIHHLFHHIQWFFSH